MKGGCPVYKMNKIIPAAKRSAEAPSYLTF